MQTHVENGDRNIDFAESGASYQITGFECFFPSYIEQGENRDLFHRPEK